MAGFPTPAPSPVSLHIYRKTIRRTVLLLLLYNTLFVKCDWVEMEDPSSHETETDILPHCRERYLKDMTGEERSPFTEMVNPKDGLQKATKTAKLFSKKN